MQSNFTILCTRILQKTLKCFAKNQTSCIYIWHSGTVVLMQSWQKQRLFIIHLPDTLSSILTQSTGDFCFLVSSLWTYEDVFLYCITFLTFQKSMFKNNFTLKTALRTWKFYTFIIIENRCIFKFVRFWKRINPERANQSYSLKTWWYWRFTLWKIAETYYFSTVHYMEH